MHTEVEHLKRQEAFFEIWNFNAEVTFQPHLVVH